MVPRDFAVDPAQAGLVLGEFLDELRPRHAALVHHEVLDLAFGLADVVDFAAHAVAQALDLARRKADLHQLGGNLLLQIDVLRRLVPFLLQDDQHAREEPANDTEALETGDLEPFEVLGGDGDAVVFAFLVFLIVVVADRCDVLGEVHEAVDHVVDLELVAARSWSRARESAPPSSGTPRSP